MSWPVATIPSRLGSSSRFVNVNANGTASPPRLSNRTSTRDWSGCRRAHRATARSRTRRGRRGARSDANAAPSSRSWSWPSSRVITDDDDRISPPRSSTQADRRAVLQQRPKLGSPRRRDLPSAPICDVAYGQQDVVAEGRTADFDEAPTCRPSDTELQQRAHLLVLHRLDCHDRDARRRRDARTPACSGRHRRERDSEQALCRGGCPTAGRPTCSSASTGRRTRQQGPPRHPQNHTRPSYPSHRIIDRSATRIETNRPDSGHPAVTTQCRAARRRPRRWKRGRARPPTSPRARCAWPDTWPRQRRAAARSPSSASPSTSTRRCSPTA